nr:hypothetical protein [Tanacetum cinerariifolium]
VRSKCRTGVETKPSNPQEDGANNDVGDIVRTVVQLLRPVATTLAEHVRVSQSGSSRSNMHGCATSEVEATKLKDPSRRVP